MNDELTYKSSGVDVEAGDRLIDRIKPFADRTKREGSIGALGGFGGFFEIPGRYQRPVLVSGTDGVGTKLKLAFEMDRHDTVGIDLVAMCANDILAQGAEPLFFLDYLATSRLDVDRAAAVIASIAEGCKRAGAALIGGETAEMPGMYSPGEYDLAGFCVGVVEKDKVIDGSRVSAGDTLVGLSSTGVHSNGFSLLRKLIERQAVSLSDDFDGRSLGELLLEPTAIYVRPMLGAMERFDIHGVAHVTGGGITGNVVRILQPGLKAVIDDRAWPAAAVFDWIESAGVKREEMLRTFNCGLGMVIAVAREQAGDLVGFLDQQQLGACIIGRIEASDQTPAVHVV